MKRAYLILFMSMLICEVFATPDSLFQSANSLYQEGRYEAALENYREIASSGFESSDLYYNMGNASFRSNNIGYAILYYEKALNLEPSHEYASHNLEFAARYRVDTFEEVPELFLRTWIRIILQTLIKCPIFNLIEMSGFYGFIFILVDHC